MTTGPELLERITELKGDAKWVDFASDIGTSRARSGVVRAKFKKDDLSVKMDFLDLVAGAYSAHAVGFVFNGKMWVPEGHNEEFQVDLGRRLRDFRESEGLLSYEMARAIKMADESVRNYEKGHVWPTVETVNAVCRVVGAESFYLIPTHK